MHRLVMEAGLWIVGKAPASAFAEIETLTCADSAFACRDFGLDPSAPFLCRLRLTSSSGADLDFWTCRVSVVFLDSHPSHDLRPDDA